MDQQNRSGGGSTPFEDMSHEDMLSWLDRADSGAVQGAADTLRAAAGEIREIAEQLKARPERVEWQGEGYKAFIEWSASLASATFRLAEYSDGASQWLGHASNAIAEAQSAIPRDVAGAKANLAAALNAPNDPDSGLVISKSSSTLATDAERNRLEAATQMRRLANVYEHSQTQMGKLEVPTFQPPPTEFVPGGTDGINSSQDRAPIGIVGSGSGMGGGGGRTHTMDSGGGAEGAVTPVVHVDSLSPAHVARPEVSVATEIASVDTQPPTTAPTATPNVPPVVGKADGPVLVAPTFGRGGPPSPSVPGGGRSTGSTRLPSLSGQGGPNAAPTGRAPTERGITGGRPVPSGSVQSGVLPRGTVVGGEGGVHGRPPMAHGAGSGLGGGSGQGGMTGRRLAGETGGVVGGRAQQSGLTGGRAFTPGGTGLVRGGATPRRPGKKPERRDEASGERPDYLVEDEETWQRSGRRIVPPVID
ncbi:WXG100 family type VII secretion target [Streptomyces sp. NPDC001780]